MGNKYTGNRYVPKVLSIEDAWSNNKEYESLTVVCWQGASYTSRKYVPVGVDINNKDYWVCTGNYNAQIEQYRQDTQNAVQNVNLKLDGFANAQDGKFQIMLDGYKQQINAYADGKYQDVNDQIDDTKESLEDTKISIEQSMLSYEQAIQQSIEGYTLTVNNQMAQIQTMLTNIDIIYDEGTSTDVDGADMTIIDEGVI